MTEILWTPSPQAVEASAMNRYRLAVNKRFNLDLKDSTALYDWSIDKIADFWDSLWDFTKIIGDKGATVLENPQAMPGCKFFPQGKINYAENLLREDIERDDVALHFWGEDKIKRHVTFEQLKGDVSRLQQFLAVQGITIGERVAAFMPNLPETAIAMLAATSLGATWSSASPDFGVQGVLDRFGQIQPRVLIAVDGYYYNGKWVDCLAKLQEIIPQIPSLQKVILVPYTPDHKPQSLEKSVAWAEALAAYQAKKIEYTRVSFNQPLFIMFSSGTTGKPKCIVHGYGGTLLQHVKEHRIQSDVCPKDRMFYFTTCGWMMWNWLMTGLASGATLCLYDGSPFAPNGNILFEYAEDVDFTLFGTSAKYIDTLHKQNYSPIKNYTLPDLRTIASTGSVLSPEGFSYVYEHIKKDVHLESVCGGTDIVACFMIGDPTKPVHRGELQGAGLGFAMDVYTVDGKSALIGEKGELVCKKPFISMPVGFWNDSDGAKYKKAYFERFPGIWHHGDFVEKTPNKGFIVYGRSDATLNPGGVRIGTAEIYSQVEQLPEILESVVVGQKFDDDERVLLFVVLAKGIELDDALTTKIKKKIREGASPRHVPAKIIAIRDIPRTKNNKISEIAVRDTINGLQVANTEALSNPEALEQYRDLPTLKEA